MSHNIEVLRNKKVLVQNQLDHLVGPFRSEGLVPVADNYPLNYSYDLLLEKSHADAMLFHLAEAIEIDKLLQSQPHTLSKIVISKRYKGAFPPGLMEAYQRLEGTDILTVNQHGLYFEELLKCLAIAVMR